MTDKEVMKLAQGLITVFKCDSETMADFCNTVIKKFEQPSRPRGKWIKVESMDGVTRYMCDSCKKIKYVNYYSFCPDCGADMTESEDNAIRL